MSQFKDLQEVLGSTQTTTINGREFKIYELSLISISELSKKFVNFQEMKGKDWGSIISENIPTAIEIGAYATRSPKTDLEAALEQGKIRVTDFVELATKVIEVNSDVFLQVVEKIKDAKSMIDKKSKGLEKKQNQKAGGK